MQMYHSLGCKLFGREHGESGYEFPVDAAILVLVVRFCESI